MLEWKKEKRKFKTKSLSSLRGYINVHVCVRGCVTERERARASERGNANARTTERLHKLPHFHDRQASATPLFTYVGLVQRHEHGKVGEVAAGAGGVCAVGVQQPAA